MKNSSIKKALGLGLLIVSGMAQASDIVENDMIVGAFASDEGVQAKTRDVRQELRQILPNCNMVVEQDLHGHLFGTYVNTYPGSAVRRKTYLVSRLIACSQYDNHGYAVGVRRAVTAKVTVNVRKNQDGSLDEIPFRVVVVDINNSDNFEIH
jgi:hypothetical protein